MEMTIAVNQQSNVSVSVGALRGVAQPVWSRLIAPTFAPTTGEVRLAPGGFVAGQASAVYVGPKNDDVRVRSWGPPV